MKPNGVKSATPILKDRGELPPETTGTPPAAAPLYPGTPLEEAVAGCIVAPAAFPATAAGADGADAGAAVTSRSISLASSWVMIPFLTSSMSNALLLSVWAGASVVKARAHPRSAIHLDFVGSMGMIPWVLVFGTTEPCGG